MLGLAVRYAPLDRHSLVLLATASPFLTLAAPVALIVFALARRWVLTGLTVLLTLAVLFVHLPQFLGQSVDRAGTTTLRVLSLNLGLGRGDPTAVVAAAKRSADVVILQELTQDAADGVVAAGIGEVFGHQVVGPHPYAGGIGIWSRFPLADTGFVPGYSLFMVHAQVQVPDVAVAPTVLGIHFAAPWPQPIDQWRKDIAKFPATLREFSSAAGSGPVIVAGDFNATHDMRPFRELLATGYRDAGEQVGAGLVRTFPVGPRRVPVVGIDHVLLRNVDATAVRTALVAGADHMALIADIAVPQ